MGPFFKRRATATEVNSGSSPDAPSDAWARYLASLEAHGIPEPGKRDTARHRPATLADEQALYDVSPSFADLLPWVEYLPESSACFWRTVFPSRHFSS